MNALVAAFIRLFRPDDLPTRLEKLGIRTTPHRTALELETASGQRLRLEASGITVTAHGATIVLDAAGLRVTASGPLTVHAAKVELNAAQLEVNSPIAKFSGTVQCETVIANSVVASSYTPGAGNIW